MAYSTSSCQSLMSECLLNSPLTLVGLPVLSDEEVLSGEPQTPGLYLSSLLMCLNCENERGGERGGGEGGGGEGVVVKVGEGAWSSHAGGIVFHLLNWKTFQTKCVGVFLEDCQTTVLHSKASKCSTEMTLVKCALPVVFFFF